MGLYHLPESSYRRRQRTDDIVIHCADTLASQDFSAADIRGWHINERRWADIGYHFVIRRDGSVEVGRPVWAVGAGVQGWNANSIHICLVGGRRKGGGEENNFTPAQWRSLRALVLTLRELDEGSERIVGHRDYPGVDKYCPSFDVAAWLASEKIPVTG
jgi:N-acetylmuramoyl-L-alanine amidase